MKNKITYFLGFIAIAVLISSCGPEKDGFIARTYHNTTSHFNYYYNANVKYEEGVDGVNETFKVPIEGYIPILYYGDDKTSKSKGGQFDIVIEKCDVALAKHKKSGWVDDLRFLIGRSRFYQGEYVLARHNFQFIIKEYPDSKLVPEVYTWLVATYYMSGMESTAEKVLAEKVSGLKLKKKHKGNLAMLKTSIEIEQEEYGLAIKTLEKDLKNIKGSHNKARAHYLLGQLHASKDKFSKSYEYFRKVSKMNTDYELIFNAKMQIAKLYIDKEDGQVDTRKVQKLLKKMLRDEKNFDYADQIYYQMALLELKAGEENEALELLKESVAQETGSQRQKSLSFYKIGQIYFYNQENYDMAEVYFDSAASFITEPDPEYDEITSINKTLKEYVGHVRTIHYQDSMVKLYDMDSTSLARYIDNLIAEEKKKQAEEEARLREEEESEASNNPRFDPFNNGGFGNGATGSGFYYDSPEGISAGKTDFQRIWGRRKAEDNWRRKNKAIQLAQEEEGGDSTGDGYDDPMKELYGDKYVWYKDIPKSDEDLASAHKKIEDALLGLGQVYRDKLNQPEKAIETFESLIRRYPDSDQAPKAYYALFRLYEDLDPYRADDYKEYICEHWPKGKYCKLANNQDVGEEAKQAKDECKSAYNALYATYKSEDYSTVVSFADFNIGRFETCALVPNMYYLKGMSYGYMKNLDSLKSTFLLIRDNFPEAEITPTVIQTLAKMGVSSKVAVTPKDSEEEANPEEGASDRNNPRFKGFTEIPKANENFYVLYFVNKESISTNELKIKIQDFNKTNFKDKNLTTSIFFYKKVQHIGYISQFKKVQDAVEYIELAEEDSDIEEVLQKEGERIVFITPTNFKTAYGKRRFADYFLFYDQFILPSLDQ